MKLEKATLSKIETLQQICISAYTKNFANHWEGNGLDLYLENQFNTQRLTKDLNSPNIGYYFINKGEKSVGFVKLNFKANLVGFDDQTTCELEKIYVLPAMKGQGLGKLALQRIIEQCKKEEKETLFLCVIDTNHAAIVFYEKMGFQFHSKTTLEVENFKAELKGMNRMVLALKFLE